MESPLDKVVLVVGAIELQKEQVEQTPRQNAVEIIGRRERLRMESKVKVLAIEQGPSRSSEYGKKISHDREINNHVRGYGEMGATEPRRRGRLGEDMHRRIDSCFHFNQAPEFVSTMETKASREPIFVRIEQFFRGYDTIESYYYALVLLNLIKRNAVLADSVEFS